MAGADVVRGAEDGAVAGADALAVGSALLVGAAEEGDGEGWVVVGAEVSDGVGVADGPAVSEPGEVSVGEVGEVEGPVDGVGDVELCSDGLSTGDDGEVVTVTSGNTTGGASGGTVACGSRFSTFTDSCCHWSTSSCLRCSSPTVATVVVRVCSFCCACSHCPSSISC